VTVSLCAREATLTSSGEVGHAQKWAVADIAELMAIERSAIDADQP
jgi:hypothetical protein